MTTRDLAAGETWHFEVPIHAEDAVRVILNAECGRWYRFYEEVVTAAMTAVALRRQNAQTTGPVLQ